MTLIDPDSAFGSRVLRRLSEETVIWLTTLGSDGMPQPSPVWFLWDGSTILIYSKPGAPKVHNIQRHPKVALSFNSDPDGSNVVIITGTAVLDQTPPPNGVPDYIAKYAELIVDISMTNDSFSAEYRQPIRFIPQKVRGY